MHRLSTFLIASAFAIASSACGSSSPTTPTTTTPNSYALLGKLSAAINGVPQSRVHEFLLGSGATVSITLASAIETMLDGTTLSTVTLGVGLGTVTNGVCTVIPGAYVAVPSGTSAQMAWAMPQGTNCVKLSDVTVQEGPVAYTITMTY